MLSTILQTRFTAIDTECEAVALIDIDHFYKDIRYDGSRFRYPSFQEVGATWVKLIKTKERLFTAEVKTTIEAMATISESQLVDITSITGNFFNEDRYIDRLKDFAKGVSRRATAYGLFFDQDACRFDIADAAFRAAVQNSLRFAHQTIRNELELYFAKRRLPMGFSSLMTDTISILKKDGNQLEGIKASVQSDKIFISGTTLLIESGDLIQRRMSNGGEETFEVIDPGFHEKFRSIPAGYQMTVKKLGIPEAKAAIQNNTFNITGHNARINQHSIDNSTNIANVNTDAIELIAILRSTVQRADLSSEEKNSATEIVDAVDAQFRSGSPRRPVVAALLSALPNAANVATIISSLLALF